MMRRALANLTASLGIDHPSTVTIRENYQRLLQTMGVPESEISKRLAEVTS